MFCPFTSRLEHVKSIDKYCLCNQIGKGKFGTVYFALTRDALARIRNGARISQAEMMACKVISKQDTDVDDIEREVGILRQLSH